MFGLIGLKKKVERIRHALIRALQAKSLEIMLKHDGKRPENIPMVDVTRSMIFHDLAEILTNLYVEDHPDDDKDG